MLEVIEELDREKRECEYKYEELVKMLLKHNILEKKNNDNDNNNNNNKYYNN